MQRLYDLGLVDKLEEISHDLAMRLFRETYKLLNFKRNSIKFTFINFVACP